MENTFLINLYQFMWSALVVTAAVFFISGLDDLFFDSYYWLSSLWRSFKLRNRKRLTYTMLAELPEKRVAVMIPCWHEAGIIDAMLRYNSNNIDYENYDLFVGVYSNDPDTVNCVKAMARENSRIKYVLNAEPGPTTKAKNLNTIFKFIEEYEAQHDIKYEIFVLQDSEDVIHPLSFKLYNYLMPRKDMIQIPVFPLDVSLKEFTHWTYNAEFCENHTKDIIVRERIGGLVPSAGVGTAFSRHVMEMLKADGNTVPFDTHTLTEDYHTSLHIRLKKLKQIFVSQYVYRKVWTRPWYYFGMPVQRVQKDFIATRAFFPMDYSKAVKQKARWMYGISFQEWVNTGWRGNFTTLYTLAHDRKTLFSHLITGFFLFVFIFWIWYSFYIADKPEYPTLQDQFDAHPWVWYVICAATFIMICRILQRFVAVWRIYRFSAALLSIPLIVYGNIINLHAALRAYWLFFFKTPKSKNASIKWEKTDHEFPTGHVLEPYRIRLGDMLIQQRFLDKDKLKQALEIQTRTGEQLGAVLRNLGYITKLQFVQALSKQFKMPIIDEGDVKALTATDLPMLSPYQFSKLLDTGIPIAIDKDNVTVAIHDPSDEISIKRIYRLAAPYTVNFVLINPAGNQ